MPKVRNDLSFAKIRERMKPLFEDEGLKLVLLFGSPASGRTHKQSDIDLVFLYGKPVDILLLTRLLQKYENNQFCHSERSEESHAINKL